MKNSSLNAISPIDGRYGSKTIELSEYFSEFALIKYRIEVEIKYFIALNEFIPESFGYKFTTEDKAFLTTIYTLFDETGAEAVKTIEQTTNHDVKAVEYYIKSKLKDTHLSSYSEWIHYGLTSQDINNTSQPLMLKLAWQEILLPKINEVLVQLSAHSQSWRRVPMLAKTHGQPASPTLLGKEIFVFHERIIGQLAQITHIPFSAKFGGATGNLNAHYVSFPDKDWISFSQQFVGTYLGLTRITHTTQIEPYDNLASFFDALKRINTIMIDLSRDMWTYISMNYFTQKIKEGEIGSSAMPHKVNPIDFENAEGNFGISNAIFSHLSSKLPISRLQRDLTDSTVLRNMGVPIAHMLIGLKSMQKGLEKVQLNQEAIDKDLDDNWAVIAEAIQTILRSKGFENPYEMLKSLTRTNEKITRETLREFINSLPIDNETKIQLLEITPFNYTGKVAFDIN